MGKKSKRKAPKRRKERRERINETVDYYDDSESSTFDLNEEPPDPNIYFGDRVWFCFNYDFCQEEDTEPDYLRCVVTKVDKVNDIYTVLPVEAEDNEDFLIEAPSYKLVRDTTEWTLRFKVGEKVLCSVGSVGVPTTISELFPVSERQDGNEDVPVYKCLEDGSVDTYFAAPYDSENYIVQRPEEFRFSEGDDVIFAAERANGMKSRVVSRESWMAGRVIRKDVILERDIHRFYAVYEITYAVEGGRKRACFILEDNDMHIARLDASPRQRLLDTIEYCHHTEVCSHLRYIASSSHLDVTTIRDLLVAKAIENANYGALLWLQEDAWIDLSQTRDAAGNGLLHQIARSHQAEHFFSVASDFERSKKVKEKINLEGDRFQPDSCILSMRNQQGRTFLHELVISGNVRALDIALSPKVGLAWVVSMNICKRSNREEQSRDIEICLKDNNGMSPHETALVLGRLEMAKMIKEFGRWHLLYCMATELGGLSMGNLAFPKETYLNALEEEKAGSAAGQLIRFFHKWEVSSPATVSLPSKEMSFASLIFRLAQRGHKKALAWFLEEDSTLMNMLPTKVSTSTDIHSCEAPELVQSASYECLNLVLGATHGNKFPDRVPKEQQKTEYERFLRCCHSSIVSAEFISFVSSLKKEIKSLTFYDYSFESLLENKLSHLEDDEDLEKRVETLNYLVFGKGLSPPDIIDVIRWRQRGILVWLVTKGSVELQNKACEIDQILRRIKDVSFLGGNVISSHLTVGAYLCFAAIEFNDLQSLEWLVTSQDIPLASIKINGWNAVHACAYYGRTEIFLWMLSQGIYQSLIEARCERKPWEQYYAIHLAVQQGFILVADFLLSAGCPSQIAKRINIDAFAEKSKYEFVREWGVAKAKPLRLENDIRRLSLLLSEEKQVDEIQRHLMRTNCMDYERWTDCDYEYYDSLGPEGKSYGAVLANLCVIRNPDFAVWLCDELSRFNDQLDCERNWHSNLFWKRDFINSNQDEKVTIEKYKLLFDDKDDLINRCLSEAWSRKIACLDPDKQDPVFAIVKRNYGPAPTILQALQEYRVLVIRTRIYRKIVYASQKEAARLLRVGPEPSEIDNLIQLVFDAATKLAVALKREVRSFFYDWDVISPDRKINLEGVLIKYDVESHPLRRDILWSRPTGHELSELAIVLTVEGYTDFIGWTRECGKADWSSKTELKVVRIAGYLGHMDIINMFLPDKDDNSFFSSTSERAEAALLGAAGAGRVAAAKIFLSQTNDIKWTLDSHVENEIEFEESREKLHEDLASSLLAVAIYGCLCGQSVSQNGLTDNSRAILGLVWSHETCRTKFLCTLCLVMDMVFDDVCYQRSTDMLKFVVEELCLNPWGYKNDILTTARRYLSWYTVKQQIQQENESSSFRLNIVRTFLTFVVKVGIDIQSLSNKSCGNRLAVDDLLSELQVYQQHLWSQHNFIKNGASVQEISIAVDNGHLDLNAFDKNGLRPIHLAAAYDRLDVLQWLVDTKKVSLHTADALGRDAQAVAKASVAPRTSEWIASRKASDRISRFTSSCYRRWRVMKWRRNLIFGIVKIQACHRGRLVRKHATSKLLTRLAEAQRFRAIWNDALSLVIRLNPSEIVSWASMKQRQLDVVQSRGIPEMDELLDATKKLDQATTSAVLDGAVSDDREVEGYDIGLSPTGMCEEEEEHDDDISNVIESDKEHWDRPVRPIELSPYAQKWRRRAPSAYLQIFEQRVRQLAAGQTSYALAKRLTGYKTRIYETKLESGCRILWTKKDDGSLVIWYISDHKSVSRLASLIDDAKKRSTRQLVLASALMEFEDSCKQAQMEHVILDPQGDTPLKMYEVLPDEICKLSDPDWKPRLCLTRREREIVETKGTVLLLGRSGTGKTCCICDRMEYDRDKAPTGASFSQLFVARSQRLRDHVKELTEKEDPGDDKSSSFCTFNQFLHIFESRCARSRNFLPSQRIDFARFKHEFYHSQAGGVDAMIAWTHIRSFIKGSIEAMRSEGRILSRTDYMNLGSRRCRVSMEHRTRIYDLFLAYQKQLDQSKQWDDCDRISALLRHTDDIRRRNNKEYEKIRYNKVYVDECQDYTQAEILLFFYACGPGDLFLAGDPAQAVVEGVDFRFEDIRAVGYYLCQICGHQRRDLIPDKPMIVNLNFRSHSGILNVAADILSCLFRVFPDSAKQLEKDRGLFIGPRPSILYKIEPKQLQKLIERLDGVACLTHDSDVTQWRHALGGYPLVYGIREAKGLEFREVILLGFFGGLPNELQKPLRDLLLERDSEKLRDRYPELEGYLKLLYTAVTRCKQQLFFVETLGGVSGEAFVRRLTQKTKSNSANGMESLAVKQSVDNLERMTRTPDEWIAAGYDNAMMAETSEDVEKAEDWLDKAIYCFEQVGDTELATKARTHRQGVRYRRLQLETEKSNTFDDSMELDLAQLIQMLLSGSLSLEVQKICRLTMPLLSDYSREHLEKHLVAKLPTIDEYY